MTINSASVIKKIMLLLLIIGGLYYAKDFFIPLAIGAVLATLFLPICRWLEVKKVPRGLAVIICLLLFILAIAGIGMLLSYQISALTNDFSILRQRGIDIIDNVQKYIYSNLGISIEKQNQELSKQQPIIAQFLKDIVMSLSSIFGSFILTSVYILFLLYYRSHIKQFLLKLSPSSQQNEMIKVIDNVGKVSQQYLLGLSKMIVCLWVMYGIAFSILGVKNALFFAFLCGLLEIVPFIGNITGTTITVLVAGVQGGSLLMLTGIIGSYGIIQFIQGWVLEPLIVGSQVKINPLFTIIALVVGNIMWGIPGIFLAIPLMAMLKIVCDHIEPLKPYGFLIGEIENKKPAINFIKKINNWYKNNESKNG
jgi:predicted PurR-regulated permease PerM